MTIRQFDVIILGTGIAGNSLAISLADGGKRVALITKKNFTDASTTWAQGGIAAVVDSLDSVQSHVQDTLNAGAGLCNLKVVEEILLAAPEAIAQLLKNGVEFTPYTKADGRYPYHLTKEGGHSHRRILHHGDHTGKSIQQALHQQILQRDHIQVFEQHMAIQLVINEGQCHGLYAIDSTNNQIYTFSAPVIVIATGGANRVYLYTTSPDVITGDGIAMAYRAGVPVCNLEFIQFHPTCLYHPKERTFLISEAVRGEGGILKTPDGRAFMQDYDERKDLAPRDIVARAIDSEMKKGGYDHVYLDISHQNPDFILSHFPTIFQRCFDLGLDIRKEPIPVVPAAHYTCGGISAAVNGRTSIRGLYAIGEAAHTGFHGANRLASNSLLEGAVMAQKAAEDILHLLQKPHICVPQLIPSWDASQVTPEQEKILINHNWDELRRVMWDYVGIVRSNKRLMRAKSRIQLIQQEVEDYYQHHTISADFVELRNLVTLAELIVDSALSRHESRGLHFNKDYPHLDPQPRDTQLFAPQHKH